MKQAVFKRVKRGATMTEYALLIVGVLLIGAGAVKLLGGKLSARMNNAGDEATSSESHSSGGSSGAGDTSGAGGGKSGASDRKISPTGDDDKSSVAGKATVGGAHDKNAAPTAPRSGSSPDQKNGDAEVAATIDTSFGMRRGFALAMMVIGVGTILFFLIKTKKAVKDVREAGK